jgi:GNAT superfamily N-acetyltransferase
MNEIRMCTAADGSRILEIVNLAAEAYRGVIPTDCWHEPYMSKDELEAERADGVTFFGYEGNGALVGVMGMQHVRDVDLIRHAYVLPGNQRSGIGGQLLAHLRTLSSKPILIGTWSDADWAIRFYQRHGFDLVSPAQKEMLLRQYWKVSDRQIETSVVLATTVVSFE